MNTTQVINCMSELSLACVAELRGWLVLVALSIGAFLAWKNYTKGQAQRRLENSLKLMQLIDDNIREHDIAEWWDVFQGTVQLGWNGVDKPIAFLSRGHEEVSLEELFAEGCIDDGAVPRLVENFELIALQILSDAADFRIIYSRFGQIMDTTYLWFGSDQQSLLHQHYPNFNKLMKKYSRKKAKWPKKSYTFEWALRAD